jgi:fructokinase
MSDKSNIYCIGEALMDFIPVTAGLDASAPQALIPLPGGGPANTAVAAAKLEAKSRFIGKVGDDSFGRMLISTLKNYGVDTSLMTQTKKACTTLAFVTLTDDGERDFTFARKPGADMLLGKDEIPEDIFKNGDILHFTSQGLVESPSKCAHSKAIDQAKKAGALISFDPNVRLDLWEEPDECRKTIIDFIPKADIIKVSLDEMPFVFGMKGEEEAAKYCFEKGAYIVFVTRGKDGASVYTQDFSAEAAPIKLKATDTTGAGDAFNGAYLSRFAARPKEEILNQKNLTEILNFANAAGALTVTKKGAMSGSPTLNELKQFIEK